MPELLTNFRWWATGEPQEMLVEDGCVVFRGPRFEGARPATIDLDGKFLLPCFVDAHCHILPTGLDLQKLNLSFADSRESVLDHVRDEHARLEPGEWLLAVHYDQNRFSDGRHLTRSELDAISEDRPMLLRHANGHASIANSAALRLANVSENQTDPPGGEFLRDESGRLTGVLLENAHEAVARIAPSPTLEQMVDAIMLAGQKMRALGISCASDMMTGRFDLGMELEAYRLAAERGCGIRTRLYVQWAEVFGPRARAKARLSELSGAMDSDRCRIAGVKIFADGAIASATAAIYGRFESTQGRGLSPRATPAAEHAGTSAGVDGQLMYSPEKLADMVRIADEAGYQVAIHSIGDYSTDLVMSAYSKVPDPHRHRIEHAMILSDAQVRRMADLGIFCTMQPEFLLRFAAAYQRQLGPLRTSALKRARSVIDAGIRLSFSSDRPIVPGDPWDGIRVAVDRPQGFDASENVSLQEAIEAYTAAGAEANGDRELIGSLLPGQLADYQVLPALPV